MIKLLTIDDYESLFAMWMAAPNMGLRSLDDSEEGIARFLDRNPSTNFAAYRDGKIVGSILCGHDGRRGYIYHTVVLPEYQVQGIGSALVSAATEALKNEHITRVCLNVMDKNEQGRRFWLNRGWEEKTFLGFFSRAIIDAENAPLFEIRSE